MVQKETHKKNYWKWAFAVLLALNIAGGIFITSKIMTPTVEQTELPKQQITQKKYSEIDVSANKSQLVAAINYYLRKNSQKTGVQYHFALHKKAAILIGTTKVLGEKVSFTLYTKPYLDKRGNIALKAQSVAIGSLNAPPAFILKYVKNNYDLGKWATIDDKKERITLNMNSLTNKNKIKIKGEKLDLQHNDIRFKVQIPLE